MKRIVVLLVLGALLLSGGNAVAAAHYPNGAEGIKAATMPPKGFYWKVYNAFYTADKLKNNSGNTGPGRFSVDMYALMNRFIYNPGIEFLGGELLMDIVIPLQNKRQTHLGVGDASYGSKSRFGFGDILVEPFVLAWHGERWDAVVAMSVFLPTGDYSKNRTVNLGAGYWTFMPGFGGTVYFDEAKTWSASILARYEFHTEQQGTDIDPGQDFHFEWGVGKQVNQYFEAGVAGYCNWQTTKNSGPGANSDMTQTYAAGPELIFNIPDWSVSVSIRSLWEFENRNATQGNFTVLSVTKAF